MATRPHWTPLDEETFTKKKSGAAFCNTKPAPESGKVEVSAADLSGAWTVHNFEDLSAGSKLFGPLYWHGV
jgi:hypothetical protein